MSSIPIVLIADEAAIVRRVVVRLIERINPAAIAIEVAHLAEALTLLSTTEVHLIVADFFFPMELRSICWLPSASNICAYPYCCYPPIMV